MISLKKVLITESIARYKFFPNDKDDYGIVELNRATNEAILIELEDDSYVWHAIHALNTVEKYGKRNDFPDKEIIAWY